MSTDQTPASIPAATSTIADVREYVTCRAADLEAAGPAIADRGIRGAEVFMADLAPRTEPLAASPEDRERLLDALRAAQVRRVHSSYWAAPTPFVADVGYGELVERFEGTEKVREYFGDLTGEHMFGRWRDEYALARDLGADAYVFHLIDYMPVDGAWAFSVDRRVVLDAMIALTQRFLRVLEQHGLIGADSPVIELENAGWGLEFGAQTADDFARVFAEVHDPSNRLRLGWDLNHLLHATGLRGGAGSFLLPDAELTPAMRELERKAGGDIRALSAEWIALNVLDERLVDRVSALHLSDCPAKEVEYFRNGLLDPEYAVEGTLKERADAGLRIVLDHYDNHVCLGDGVLDPAEVRRVIAALAARHPLMLLHELKNAPDIWAELDRQRALLWSDAPASAV